MNNDNLNEKDKQSTNYDLKEDMTSENRGIFSHLVSKPNNRRPKLILFILIILLYFKYISFKFIGHWSSLIYLSLFFIITITACKIGWIYCSQYRK